MLQGLFCTATLVMSAATLAALTPEWEAVVVAIPAGGSLEAGSHPDLGRRARAWLGGRR